MAELEACSNATTGDEDSGDEGSCNDGSFDGRDHDDMETYNLVARNKRMWKRLLQVERDMEADRAGARFSIAGTADLETAWSKEMDQLLDRLLKIENEAPHLQLDLQLIRRTVSLLNEILGTRIPGVKGSDFDVNERADNCYIAVAKFTDLFKDMKFEAVIRAVMRWLDDRRASSKISSLRTILFLTEMVVCDQLRKWESRFLKLFWRHSSNIPEEDLLICLSKFAEHYSSFQVEEVESLEEIFLGTNEERATFLTSCANLDIAAGFAKDLNTATLRQTQGEKAKCSSPQREEVVHTFVPSGLAHYLTTTYPFSARLEIGRGCFDRFDLVENITHDLNPDESGTVASVISSFKQPELQTLTALKREMEVDWDVILQAEELNAKHLNAYKALKDEQQKTLEKFFRNCEEEKRNVVQEALYKKAKCLASVKKANIRNRVKLTSEVILKKIVQKTGNALKELEEERLQFQSTQEVGNDECALCYSKIGKKRKRACLDPCGHAGACLDCATKAWTTRPNCPWCNASIQKPIPLPARLFF